jgi:spermidine/putrescine-binding protein
MDDTLIVETWDVFREYIPDKHKETAANHFIDFLLGKDVAVSVLEGFMGYDPFLDQAIELVINESEDNDDDYEEDDSEEDY